MADVKIVDIDNVQWNIKDQLARNKIEEINQLLKIETINNIPIILNGGNSASGADIRKIQRFGKIYSGLIYISKISAKNIGTLNRATIGTVNINVLQDTYALGFDALSSKLVRIRIDINKNLYLEESVGVPNGNNLIFVPITWIGL